METSNSGANHAVLRAQNERLGLGRRETINSGHNVAVVNAQNHRWGLGPIETCNSGVKSLFWMHKTTDEGWDYKTSVIQDLSMPFCIHKSTGEVWDP